MNTVASAAHERLARGVVLSHPGTGMFVQQTGRALYEAGLLKRFVTTLADRPEASWRRWLPGSWDTLLQKRGITEFPTGLIQTFARRELMRLLARGMDRTGGVLTDAVWEWSERGFDRRVATRGLEDATAVYGFEHACRQTFEAARRRGMARIYDVPAPEGAFSQQVREQEIAECPALDSAYQRRLRATHPRHNQQRREEFELADLVIANSEFTKSTYQRSGLDVSKVCVVPLGAPPVCGDEVLIERAAAAGKRPLRFLSVGSFTLHKGSHHLLTAWRKLDPGKRAVLQIAGRVDLPANSFAGLGESVQRLEYVPRTKIMEIYREADVLVFPSLCDGFGMVVTEALSQGLPVITTPSAGASELILSKSNGLIVPSRNSEELATALEWCLTHRAELGQMNWHARETAGRWQWADYRRKLVEEISNRLAR